MKSKSLDIFSSNNLLKILSYLAENLGKELLGNEIQKATSISRTGVYIALQELVRHKLVLKNQKGKFLVYSLKYDEPVVKQFKILKNILLLQDMTNKLKPVSKKIMLYGSAGRGEDYPDSDLDLLVISTDSKIAQKIISSVRIKRKIQTIIKTPSEFSNIKHTDEIFYQEVARGIILWEDKK